MKRFAQTVLLKDDPEVIRRYEEYHAHPWPEVLEGSQRIGVLRTLIFRRGRLLFTRPSVVPDWVFMETRDDFDLERDMPKYAADPKAQEWDALMRGFQEALPGSPEGATWAPMKEVFAWSAED